MRSNQGRTTAVELVEAYQARIAPHDGPRDSNPPQCRRGAQPRCLKEAEASDARRARGKPWAARRHPLHRQGQLSGQG